jgi:5-formyltetrahydrofolate cyclo-ligase
MDIKNNVVVAQTIYSSAVASTGSASLRQRKTALRKLMRTSLAALTPEELAAQSQAVTTHVTRLPDFKQSRAVAIFLSMPSGEIDTRGLVESIFRQNKRCFVPKVIDKKQRLMGMYEVKTLDDIHKLPSGVWGIPEPSDDTLSARTEARDCAELDMIIMPGLAFDDSNLRMGHGGGFYDRYLQSMRKARATRDQSMPHLLGIALQPQRCEAGVIPIDDTDHPVDRVVFPDGPGRKNE